MSGEQMWGLFAAVVALALVVTWIWNMGTPAPAHPSALDWWRTTGLPHAEALRAADLGERPEIDVTAIDVV